MIKRLLWENNTGIQKYNLNKRIIKTQTEQERERGSDKNRQETLKRMWESTR
jgi:hypothetical protein